MRATRGGQGFGSILAAVIGVVSAAHAQPPTPDGWAHLRLRYGATHRAGEQSRPGPGLSYDGVTPNDVALSGSAFFGPGRLGGGALLQREAFSLRAGSAEVTGGSLWRGHVGPAARVWLRPAWVELLVGYGLAQLPFFTTPAAGAEPRFDRAVRHAALIAGRLRLPLPRGFTAEVRGELPFALSTSDGSGGSARSNGFAAGAALGLKLATLRGATLAALLDYQFVRDRVFVDDGSARQTLSRLGLALELRFGPTSLPPTRVADPPPPAASTPEEPAKGALTVQVVKRDDQSPVAGARVSLIGREWVADAQGRIKVEGLPPGPMAFTVAATGFRTAEEVAQVVSSKSSDVLVLLLPLAQRAPAGILGQVRSSRG
ncbi:MAG TPA: carboxypeptidase-like regulatory domain-containing protein, partial [Myxococcaceae bacterium]|nr:carboxypeptidase-like regulatory domain-containing protein [Myxococcaceae bacterium]